jgi:2-hydroxy-6-oxonona-2,4-dienedioate hydrolase
MKRPLLLGTAILLTTLLTAVVASYGLDMHRAYKRVRGKTVLLPSPYGTIEYSEGGAGTPVLVIHGGGGGFDQGELLVDAVLGDGFHWITPSRFGYLGSDLPEGATWDDQAHALAYLLDYLGVERVAVVALSQGGPSGLLLAALHPERVSSVTCLSCGVAASTSGDQEEANKKGDLLRRVFARDYTYWAVARFFPKQLTGVLGASDEVTAGLTREERALVKRLIVEMNPASPRLEGVVLDNTAQMPGERIGAIDAPTLIVHARDDLLQLYHNAEFAASTIPGARLMSFDRGGHLVILVERGSVARAVRAHILSSAHAGAPDPR